MNDQEQVNTLLAKQRYMVLAVTLDDGSPWATPVRIKEWHGNTFEWDSKTDTEHSKAIAKRPQIAISIYTPEGEGTIQFGLYAKATVELVSEHDGMGRYSATVSKSWVNDASFVKREVVIPEA